MPKHCNFYILPHARENGRFIFCCALIEKLYAQGHKVYVHCRDREEASRFNDFLWTYKDISFIPHSLSGEQSVENSPIQIGFTAPSSEFKDVLIFLSVSSELSSFCAQFDKIVEIVNAEPMIKEALRLRFQHYRSQGYEIKTHPIN